MQGDGSAGKSTWSTVFRTHVKSLAWWHASVITALLRHMGDRQSNWKLKNQLAPPNSSWEVREENQGKKNPLKMIMIWMSCEELLSNPKS